MRTLHGARPLPRLERCVFQGRLSIDENPSSAAATLHCNPATDLILANDELQPINRMVRFLRFADV
jgi:hypothetical protein